MLQHLLVALGMAVADVMYTLWARKASQSKPIASAVWASLIIPTYGYVVIMYNANPQYLLSAMFGAFIGTYLTVKLDSRVKNDKNTTSAVHSNVFDNFEGREIVYPSNIRVTYRSESTE